MIDKKNKTVVKAFTEYLHANGLRLTYERATIGHTITTQHKPFDVQHIKDVLDASNEKISLATIYNNIGLMVKAGILKRMHADDGTSQYISADTSSYFPNEQCITICTVCGNTKDLKPGALLKEKDSRKTGSFTPLQIAVTAYGICTKCARQIKRDKNKETKSKYSK